LSVHGAAPLNRDVSGCRLPILVFCGNDDDGLHLADDEYLGQPL
jgi:hypothetical protein